MLLVDFRDNILAKFEGLLGRKYSVCISFHEHKDNNAHTQETADRPKQRPVVSKIISKKVMVACVSVESSL